MTASRVWYNEIDPFAADWLRTLIAMGALPEGDVDERSIEDVTPADLATYTQCHFFAGIGGWAVALDLAGWSRDRPVWTGSCPCQSFSAAGKGGGFDDRRHLWPAWRRLIRERRPGVVFGEQVEAAIRHGWLDLVSTDLEAEGYAFGASVLGAHSVGAPHIRQRVFFVADAERRAAERSGLDVGDETGSIEGRTQERQRLRVDVGDGSDARTVADASAPRLQGRTGSGRDGERGIRREPSTFGGAPRVMGDSDREREGAERGVHGRPRVESARGVGVMGDSDHPRSQGRRIGGDGSDERAVGAAGVAGPWSDLVWLPCRDGKARPTQPGIFPLAHGVPNRVGTLRGAGNAIVPEVAAEFIRAYCEVIGA